MIFVFVRQSVGFVVGDISFYLFLCDPHFLCFVFGIWQRGAETIQNSSTDWRELGLLSSLLPQGKPSRLTFVRFVPFSVLSLFENRSLIFMEQIFIFSWLWKIVSDLIQLKISIKIF